jgi:lipoate-protein ligase A
MNDHSPRIVFRLDPPLSGRENMEIDEALLMGARADDPIVVRIYQWQEPTLSLGHFQTIDQWKRDPRVRDVAEFDQVPWVRRKTGGGAILHDQEWTYSISVPSQHPRGTKGHSEILYRSVHMAIRDGLNELGWPASLAEHCTCSPTSREKGEPFLCFQRRTPVDVVVGEHKILGSAQRRHASGLLQHGSFLLHSSSIFPELRGLEQLHTPRLTRNEWAEWLETRLRMGIETALAPASPPTRSDTGWH